MKYLLFLFLILILSSCEDNIQEEWHCPWEDRFNTIQDNFWAYHIEKEDNTLFAYFEGFDSVMYISIQKSTDKGLSWEEMFKIHENPEKNIILDNFLYTVYDFDQSANGDLWVLGGSGYIYKSTDKGKSWSRENNPNSSSTENTDLDLITPNSIHINPNGEIFIFDFWSGILRSRDNGISWDWVVHSDLVAHDYIQFLDDKICYYQRDGGLHISYDGADTWIEPLGLGADEMTYFRKIGGYASQYKMLEGDDGLLYFFIGQISNKDFFIYKSSDNGKSWQGKMHSFNIEDSSIDNFTRVASNGDIYVFASKNNYSSNCYDHQGLFKSTDGGRNWKHILKMSANGILTEDNYAIFHEQQYQLKLSKEPVIVD